MKISTKGRYALRMMVDPAIHQGTGYVALKDIAERQNISKKYLEQIVPLLNKAEMLKTNRGYQGGYALSKPPEKYTVGEILRVTEGSLSPVSCLQYEENTTIISLDACGIIACFGSKGSKWYAEGKCQRASEDAQQE